MNDNLIILMFYKALLVDFGTFSFFLYNQFAIIAGGLFALSVMLYLLTKKKMVSYVLFSMLAILIGFVGFIHFAKVKKMDAEYQKQLFIIAKTDAVKEIKKINALDVQKEITQLESQKDNLDKDSDEYIMAKEEIVARHSNYKKQLNDKYRFDGKNVDENTMDSEINAIKTTLELRNVEPQGVCGLCHILYDKLKKFFKINSFLVSC